MLPPESNTRRGIEGISVTRHARYYGWLKHPKVWLPVLLVLHGF